METPLQQVCAQFKTHLEKQLLEVLRVNNFHMGLKGFVGEIHSLHERVQAQENLQELVSALQSLHQKINQSKEIIITPQELSAAASRLLARDPPANFIDKNASLYFAMARYKVVSELEEFALKNDLRSFYKLYNANANIIKKSDDEATRKFTRTISNMGPTVANRNSFMASQPTENIIEEKQTAKKIPRSNG